LPELIASPARPAGDGFAAIFGPHDAPNVHAPNERVLLGELERAVVAEAELLTENAARKENRR
jgi:acetylornithine deacetylase/succinyl-diaminopimelate desuccinylase-like protein